MPYPISCTACKDGAEALARPLTLLMNRKINEGTLSADWKHAIVTPVHKAGSKSDPTNFQPISVLPVFSKILACVQTSPVSFVTHGKGTSA